MTLEMRTVTFHITVGLQLVSVHQWLGCCNAGMYGLRLKPHGSGLHFWGLLSVLILATLPFVQNLSSSKGMENLVL